MEELNLSPFAALIGKRNLCEKMQFYDIVPVANFKFLFQQFTTTL